MTHNFQSDKFAKLFAQCPDHVLDAFFSAGAIMPFPKGKSIFSQHAAAKNIYFLLSGMVKIYTIGETEQVMIKDIIYPSNFFGENALFSTSPSKESALSIDDKTEVLVIQIEAFKMLTAEHPILLTILLNEIGKKLVQKEEKLASFHFNDAKSRIVNFIKETASMVGTKVGYETLIRHSFTQQDIANITGTSRQTVTFVMNSLKKSNVIHFDRRRILIRDLSLL